MPDFLTNPSPAAYTNISKISICYYTKYCSGQPNQTIPSSYLSTYQLTIGGNNLGGSLNETIKTTCLAYYDVANPANPMNQATLDSLTQQFATDYTNFKQFTFDMNLAGVCQIAPNALTDVIEWKYLSEKHANYTRLYSYPLNFMIFNLAHYDYQGDCANSIDTGLPNWDGQPYRYYWGPPGMCSGSSLQLTRYGLLFSDVRLTSKYISTDTL